jgi:hypothetical protein
MRVPYDSVRDKYKHCLMLTAEAVVMLSLGVLAVLIAMQRVSVDTHRSTDAVTVAPFA